MARVRRYSIVALAGFAVAACESPVQPTDNAPQPQTNQTQPIQPAALPVSTFAPCAACHNSKDGFDLAYFSYADTTIIRRALKHVNQATAQTIVTYLKQLKTAKVAPKTLLFQPGGAVLAGAQTSAGDKTFALGLFKQDGWPSTWTRATVLAINPRTVPVALELMPWSDEANNVDWIPDDSLPPAIAAASATALSAYRSSPTVANLQKVEKAVLTAASTGVCKFGAWDFKACFNINRWVASLAAVHMLRNNQTGFIASDIHQQWWETGDLARRSSNQTGQLANWTQLQLRWQYLAWQFDPMTEPAIHTVGSLMNFAKLPRHGVWVALRSIVARRAGPLVGEYDSPYNDWTSFATVTPAGTAWAYNGAVFALNELVRRVNAGDRPATVTLRNVAVSQVTAGMTSLKPKVTATQWNTLNTKANTVRTALKK